MQVSISRLEAHNAPTNLLSACPPQSLMMCSCSADSSQQQLVGSQTKAMITPQNNENAENAEAFGGVFPFCRTLVFRQSRLIQRVKGVNKTLWFSGGLQWITLWQIPKGTWNTTLQHYQIFLMTATCRFACSNNWENCPVSNSTSLDAFQWRKQRLVRSTHSVIAACPVVIICSTLTRSRNWPPH